MNLKALQSLVAIHDLQSFLDAGRRLGVAQSAVSMQMKALEEELGVALFDRSVRPPAMTPAATAIVRPARQALELIETIRALAQAPAALEGDLALGCVPTATVSLLPGAAKAIGQRHPAVRLRVRSGLSDALIAEVEAGTLDAAVVTEPAELAADLRAEPILTERLALVSAIDGGPPPGLDAVMRGDFIRFNREVGVGRIIDRYLAAKGVEPAEFMELDSLEAILAMVERGIGVAIVPESALDAWRRRIVIRLLEGPEAERALALVCRADSSKSNLIEAALGLFRRSAGERAPSIERSLQNA